MEKLSDSGETKEISGFGKLDYEFLRSKLCDDSIEIDITYYSISIPKRIFKQLLLGRLKK